MHRSLLACIFIVSLLATGFVNVGVTAAAVSQPQSHCKGWASIPGPNPSQYNSGLSSVTASAANDVWAVGGYQDVQSGVDKTLAAHWNGTNWNVVSSPSPGIEYNGLSGVSRVPQSNQHQAWAVGYYSMTPIGPPRVDLTLIEQWKGTAWNVVTSPNVNPGVEQNDLFGVAAISAKDVWAVGVHSANNQNNYETLIEHWDGTQWSIVPSPNAGSRTNYLYSVAAISSKDVWAVGYYFPDIGSAYQTLIEHWDGTSWSVVSSPSPGSLDNKLAAIASIPGSNELWAVGYYSSIPGPDQTLIEQWNGSSWSVVPGPNPGSSIDSLTGVASISKSDAWAVGYDSVNNSPFQTLILRWNGTNWQVVPSPNPGPEYNILLAATHVPGTTQAWTVGDSFSPNQGIQQTLTAFHC